MKESLRMVSGFSMGMVIGLIYTALVPTSGIFTHFCVFIILAFLSLAHFLSIRMRKRKLLRSFELKKQLEFKIDRGITFYQTKDTLYHNWGIEERAEKAMERFKKKFDVSEFFSLFHTFKFIGIGLICLLTYLI